MGALAPGRVAAGDHRAALDRGRRLRRRGALHRAHRSFRPRQRVLLRGAALDRAVDAAGPFAPAVADLPRAAARGRARRDGRQDPSRAGRRDRGAADHPAVRRSRAGRAVPAAGRLPPARARRPDRLGSGYSPARRRRRCRRPARGDERRDAPAQLGGDRRAQREAHRDGDRRGRPAGRASVPAQRPHRRAPDAGGLPRPALAAARRPRPRRDAQRRRPDRGDRRACARSRCARARRPTRR